MVDKFEDYYEVLGVSKDASDAEIKSAFRELAKKYHPDVSKEPNAEEKFKKVQEAYAVLSGASKKSRYDVKDDKHYGNCKKSYSDEEREYAKKIAIKKLIYEQIAQAKDLFLFKERIFDIANLNMTEHEFKIMRDSYISKIKQSISNLKELLLLNLQYKLKSEKEIEDLIFELESLLKTISISFSVFKQLIVVDKKLSDYKRILDFRESIFLRVYLGNINDCEYRIEVLNWLTIARNYIRDLDTLLIIDKKYNYGKNSEIKDLLQELKAEVSMVPLKMSDVDMLVHIDDEILSYCSLFGFRERMICRVYDDNLDVSGFEKEALKWLNKVEGYITRLKVLLKFDEKYKYGKKEKIKALIKKLEAEKDRVYLKLSDYEFSYRRVINGSIILKSIINKSCNNLDKDELKFLYGLHVEATVPDCYSDIFYGIKSQRHLRKDMALIFGCDETNVFSPDENFDEKMVVCLGDLRIKNGDDFSRYSDLKAVLGSICAYDVGLASFLKKLEYVRGDLVFPKLLYSTGFDHLIYIGGNASFYKILDATHFSSLEYIGGRADFGELFSSKGFSNLKYIGDVALFDELCDASYFLNLTDIEGHACFGYLRKSKGLNKLRYAGGVFFPSLVDASDLINLHVVYDYVQCNALVDTYGLSNLVYIGDFMELPSVKCARGLNGLKYVGGSVRCNSLEDPSGLEKLEYIGGRADFSSLQHLTKGDKSWIRFFNYSNLSGLVSLKTIKGQAYFSSNIDISELDDVEIDSAIKIGNKVYRM